MSERDRLADPQALQRREAALGRALSLLKPLWMRAPTDERCFAAPPTLSPASSWPDVRRWIADEPREDDEPNTHYDRVSGLWTHLHWLSTHKRTVRGRWVFNHTRSEYAKTPDWSENMDDDETPQVMEVANPAERAAAGVDPALARWRGFSDEDLAELRAGALDRHGMLAIPAEYRERAGRLVTELRKVIEAREAEGPSYRGPGRYRDPDGADYEVIGWGVDGASGQRMILYRMPTAMSADQPNGYWGIPVESFERREDAERAFEYLGPLEGS